MKSHIYMKIFEFSLLPIDNSHRSQLLGLTQIEVEYDGKGMRHNGIIMMLFRREEE